MRSLRDLSKLYAEYYIYPVKCFDTGSPAYEFFRMFPKNYFSQDMFEFLKFHRYSPVQRGADLPWWGSQYFSDDKGTRVMIISQDSLSDDAGSVVFWAQLFDVVNSQVEYSAYTSRLSNKNLFRYNSWFRVQQQLCSWGLDIKHCFITDAAKVYKLGSWKDRDFDKTRSRRLLKGEIELCQPDLIITLGASPVTLINDEWSYGDIVGKKVILVTIPLIVAPFFIGNGPTQPCFKERMEKVTIQITELISDGEDDLSSIYLTDLHHY